MEGFMPTISWSFAMVALRWISVMHKFSAPSAIKKRPLGLALNV
jgi:hypothetical protein